MNRLTLLDLRVLLLDLIVEARARLPHLLVPRRALVLREVELEFFGTIDQLAQHDLGIADDGQVGIDLPSDSRRRRVDLDVLALVGPGRRLAEMLAAPE